MLAGLTPREVIESRQSFGSNSFTPPQKVPLWEKFLEKFDDATIQLLMAAAVVSLLVAAWLTRTDGTVGHALDLWARHAYLASISVCFFHFIEGIGILLAVGIATGVGLYNDIQSEKAFEAIKKLSDDIQVKVRRDNTFHTIPIQEIVVGDIVLLEAGDKIPADGYLLGDNGFTVDQSSLTGETDAIRKVSGNPTSGASLIHQPVGVCRGTTVRTGTATMKVSAVGDKTEMGAIAQSLSSPEAETPLQGRLAKLADVIGKAGMVSAVAIFLALFITRVCLPGLLWHPNAQVLDQLVRYFIIAVTIVVVAVPEGLPMMVTLSLALAARKLVKSKCLVRTMAATETIGCVTVICSDKTGTLTKNQMRIRHFITADGLLLPPFKSLFEQNPHWPTIFALNSTAELQGKEVVGSSTEGAFLIALAECGIDYRSLRAAHPILERIPFQSDAKWMSTTCKVGEEQRCFLKGAPEKVLEQCEQVATRQGVLPFSPELQQKINAEIKAAAEQSMRTLAFAQDGIFLGIAAIADPVREEIPASLSICRSAGVAVKMVTGDNPSTAIAIAREIGLLSEGDLVLTGDEFSRMSDKEILEKHSRIKVIARSCPRDKKRLVELLQRAGEVVAVTGDGTNDAPALKQADVGLAMGIAGTEVAKDASDLVLLDDNFATIVSAIRWGRTLYQNIQRFVQFQLTVNVAALAIALIGPFLGVELPLTAVQLLWVNIIMDTLAGLALGSELPREQVMLNQPIPRNASIVTPAMFNFIGLSSLYLFICLTWMLKMPGGASLRTQTVFFSTFVFFQVWNEFNARSLGVSSAFQQLGENRGFLAVVGLISVVQVLLVTWGGNIFRTTPLGWQDWGTILLSTASVLILGELVRYVLRTISDRKTLNKNLAFPGMKAGKIMPAVVPNDKLK